MMDSNELRKVFLEFFERKEHKIVASSSLIPADPTSLFTSAGMQQFVLYLAGKKDAIADFGTRHLASCQKCVRTDDIEEVGDDTHHTFFEMLGNWSVGEDPETGYFKEGAIKYALEFLVNTLHLDKNRLWATIFKGEGNIPRDSESERIWQENGIPKERIRESGKEDNVWGPVGETGPCGPNSEIFYDRGEEFGCGNPDCGPNCPKCLRFVEIWNLVFMEYNKDEKGNYEKLPQRNVDTGIGFERLLAILQGKPSAYKTDLFWPTIQEIEKQTSKKHEENKKEFRILTDHLRAAAFMIGDGILPSNVEQGYILRRILRRSIRYARILDLPQNWYVLPIKRISEIYGNEYPEVRTKQENIITVIQKEEEKFARALERGLKQFEKLLEKKEIKTVTGHEAFDLFQSYGFPLELTEELAREKGFGVDKQDFQKELEKHREISRAGVEKKFGGVGIKELKKEEEREKATKLHTATHLLLQALREALGKHVQQMGSDINPERLRFDFSHPEKLTEEQIKKVEGLVNQKIKEDLIVKKEKMPLDLALKSGALAFFKEKYPEQVNVYSIQDSSGQVFSKEICQGPHVQRTSELGHFKILKEESSGAGTRRIKAVLQ